MSLDAWLAQYTERRAERVARDRAQVAEVIRGLAIRRSAEVVEREKRDQRRAARKARTQARRRAKLCALVPGIEYLALDPCAYCGDSRPTTHDHIEPVYRGGAHDLTNLARACWRCNRAKNTQPLLLFLARRAQRLTETSAERRAVRSA